jgi:DNA-binding transcriptional LysR family regulator
VYQYRLEWVGSFVAVAEHGGFSAAAQASYRSQSRVSAHVARLEAALGARLFDRSAHPAALTPEGRAVLPHARAMLDHLGAARAVAAAVQGLTGEVRFGSYPSAAAYLYPRLVARLRERHPGVRVRLREGSTVELAEALARGDADLVVRPVLPEPAARALESRLLWTEPLVAVVADDDPLAGRAAVGLAELARRPLVTVGDGEAGEPRPRFESDLAFARAGVEPRVACQTNQPQTLVSLVRHGVGVGVTNRLAMTTSNLAGVRLVPLAGDVPGRRVAVWWRTGQAGSPVLDAVRDAVCALARSGDGTGAASGAYEGVG